MWQPMDNGQKERAASAEANTAPKKNNCKHSLTPWGRVCQEQGGKLRSLRLEKRLSLAEMARVVRRRYPKCERTLINKCEHGDQYGVQLKAQAMRDLMAEFAPEELSVCGEKAARREFRRLPFRIYGRLSKSDYEALQRAMRADGYATVQEWILAAVRRYLAGRKERAK